MHKLTKHGTGSDVWGECTCGMWCWLGTYHGDKRRTTELRAQFAEHLAYEATHEEAA